MRNNGWKYGESIEFKKEIKNIPCWLVVVVVSNAVIAVSWLLVVEVLILLNMGMIFLSTIDDVDVAVGVDVDVDPSI